MVNLRSIIQGWIQDFKLGGEGGGAHLKKLRRAEGGVNIFGVFRLKKITILRQKFIFCPIAEGGTKVFGVISCEKLRFYAKKIIFFSNFRGGACRVRPLDPPLHYRPPSLSDHLFMEDFNKTFDKSLVKF
jgi:hypothetical protein